MSSYESEPSPKEHGTHRLSEDTGTVSIRLHADVHGSGSRIVLVHGFTQTARCWGPLLDDLARDHEVVAVDAPGHGGSSSIAVDLWKAGELIGDVGGHGDYVGYSMGGRMLLHLALQNPHLVRRMVLISTTAGLDTEAERASRIQADTALAERLELVGLDAFIDEWLSGPLFSGLAPTDAEREARLGNTMNGLCSSLLLAGTGTQTPLWDQLGSLTMPVLVVAGTEDTKFTALARRLLDAIGPNAELLPIEGAGHCVHLEQPREFTIHLREWLART